MPFIKNTTEQEITVGYGGRTYSLKPGKIVEIDDPAVAMEFVRRNELPPSTKDKRPHAVHQVAFVRELAKDEAPSEKLTFLIPETPLSAEQLAARESYSLQGKPRPAGVPMPEPVEDVRVAAEKARIAKADPDVLMREGKKRKVWRSGIEKAELVDGLHAAGLRM